MGTYYVRDFEAGTIWPEFVFTNTTTQTVAIDGPGTITETNAGEPATSPATTSKSLSNSLYPKNHGNSDSSSVTLTLTTDAPGTVSYWRNVQSESCCDFFRFAIDGVQQEVVSGTPGWAKVTFNVTSAGTHTFTWSFSTDGSVLIGFSGYRITDIEVSNASPNPSYSSGGSGGGALGGATGSGTGNMLGSLFFGETMLGSDPGPGTGGGNGYGNTSNMLGIFMLGEPMLGADPSNGSGTGQAVVGPSGSVFQMSGSIAGRTTVTAAATASIGLRGTNIAARTTVAGSLTQSSLRAGYVVCGTTVHGALSTASFFSPTTINTRTTVTANLAKRIPPLSATAISCSTSVTGSLTRSILRGSIYSPMYVAATLNLTEQVASQTARGVTTVSSSLGIARSFANVTISTGTTVHANLTYSSVFSGGSSVCGTTVTGSIIRSYLRGSISCGTTVSGVTPNVRSAYTGLIHGRTVVAVVEGGFQRTLRALLSTDVQTIACGTTVHGRTYVTPTDFVPIYLNTSTRVQGNARLLLRFGSANLSNFSHGSTAVTGYVTGLQTMTGIIRGKTGVTAKAKAGFGGEIIAFAYVDGRLGVRYLFTHARVQTIVGRTTVVAARPENGTAGHSWGGTRFAYTYGTPDSDAINPFTGKPGFYVTDQYLYRYVGNGNYQPYYTPHLPTLMVVYALKADASKGGTRLNSLVIPSRAYAHNHKGPAPFYGPYGSVSLYISPKGDVGYGDFIDCQTLISGSMLTLRHRLIQILGATGLEFPGQIVFTGDAVRGTGTRSVTSGNVLQKQMAQRKPAPQNVYYV